MRRIPGGNAPHANGIGRRSIGRALALVVPIMGTVLFALAACTQASAGPVLAADQTFVWPMQQRNTVKDETFDPAQIIWAYDVGSAQMLYSGLVTLRQDLTVQDDLAQSHDISADGLTYTFHLYPGIKFSDGTSIRSQDFAFAINRSLDPCTASPVSYYLYELKDAATFNAESCTNGQYSLGTGQTGKVLTTLIGDSIQTPDSQTLVLKLGAPAAYFLEALTYPTSYPLEQSLLAKYPDGQWVMHLDQGGASGPFKVESYTQTYNGHPAVVYEPNPYWKDWHDPSAQLHITKVIRPFVFSADTMYQEYHQNNYDYTDVPESDYAYAAGHVDFNEVEGLEIQYFEINFNIAPFDDPHNGVLVRQAFDLALNKQLMADSICRGGCIPTNHIVPQGMPGYDAALTNPPADGTQSVTGNQTAAVKLLQQAVQACHGPDAVPADPDYCPYFDAAHYTTMKELDIWSSTSDSTRLKFVNAAVSQWNSVFASFRSNVQVKTIDNDNTYYANIAGGNYAMWAIGWLADYPDPQDWISLQFMSTSGSNLSHVHDSSLDNLMTKADQDPNPSSRMSEYNSAEQQLVNMVPWIPYEQAKITWSQRTWVRGFSLNGAGTFTDVSWPNVYIAQH